MRMNLRARVCVFFFFNFNRNVFFGRIRTRTHEDTTEIFAFSVVSAVYAACS